MSEIEITRDIAISTRVFYLPQESNPQDLRWVFAYEITIKNVGSFPLRLISRHWEIASGSEEDFETVDGPGVVGETPRLMPNEEFKYTSAAVLKSSFGTMEGHYNFQDDEENWFRAPIEPFILAIPSQELN